MSTNGLGFRSMSTDPQSLLSTIVRDRILESRYWKERCFALTAETILDRAKDIDAIGTTYGGFSRPTHFLCLLLKLLQIQPDISILKAYLDYSAGGASNEIRTQKQDLRYMRALAAAYVRLMCSPETVYVLLEPLLSDYRTLYLLTPSKGFEHLSMDELVEKLLNSNPESAFDLVFPFLPKRSHLEERRKLREYRRVLDEES
jgi:pre-mRNA-splicing factor 38A